MTRTVRNQPLPRMDVGPTFPGSPSTNTLSMPIPPEISATFPSDTRDRGQQYYRRGVVRIVSVDNGIAATVRGSEMYDVRIAPDANGAFGHECSCPAWATYGVCKHVWATLLAADSQRLLRFDGLPRTRARGPGAVRPPELSWKRKLQRIRDRVPDPVEDTSQSTFPSDRRIVYVVDLVATRNLQRGLAVELAMQRRMPNGEWTSPKQFGLREDQWLTAPDPLDRQIAQMLTGALSDLRPASFGVVNRRYYLEPISFDTTLRLMCETGRCRVSIQGESDPLPLAWDTGEPWELRVDIAPLTTTAPEGAPNGVRSLRVQGWL